jgi:hypothetical protein
VDWYRTEYENEDHGPLAMGKRKLTLGIVTNNRSPGTDLQLRPPSSPQTICMSSDLETFGLHKVSQNSMSVIFLKSGLGL